MEVIDGIALWFAVVWNLYLPSHWSYDWMKTMRVSRWFTFFMLLELSTIPCCYLWIWIVWIILCYKNGLWLLRGFSVCLIEDNWPFKIDHYSNCRTFYQIFGHWSLPATDRNIICGLGTNRLLSFNQRTYLTGFKILFNYYTGFYFYLQLARVSMLIILMSQHIDLPSGMNPFVTQNIHIYYACSVQQFWMQ